MSVFNLTHYDDQVEIIINGDITGAVSFPEIDSNIKTIRIDLDHLGYINSLGIKNWINWIGSEVKKVEKLVLTNCPSIFIEQINMLPDMIYENTLVESFKVPYYIESTDSIINKVFLRGIDFEDDVVNLKELIEIDGVEAELDIDPSTYFGFLKK